MNLRDAKLLREIAGNAGSEMRKESHPVVRVAWGNLANGAIQVATGIEKIARDRQRAMDLRAAETQRKPERTGRTVAPTIESKPTAKDE